MRVSYWTLGSRDLIGPLLLVYIYQNAKAPKVKGKNTENVFTDDFSLENCAEVMKEILNRLTNIESKVDITNNLVKSLENKVNEAEKKLVTVESELASLSANYDAILSRLNYLEAENKLKSKEYAEMKEENLAAKISINKNQQRGRLCTVRVLNMKDEVKNSREAASYLYDALFKATLTDLKGSHPGYGRVIEYAHLLPSPPNKKRKFDEDCAVCRAPDGIFTVKRSAVTQGILQPV